MSLLRQPRRGTTRSIATLLLGAVLISPWDGSAQRAPKAPATANTTKPSRMAAARARAQEGLATYYAGFFHGRRTASGSVFDSTEMIAAHPTLPFGTRVRVSNLRNGKSVVVRITDRGPAAKPQARGIIIDLSHAAANTLGFISAGRAKVKLEVLPKVASR